MSETEGGEAAEAGVEGAGAGEGAGDEAQIPLPPWEEAQERIFVALRPMSFFHQLGAASVLAQRSLPHLVECVTLSLGDAITYLTEKAPAAWGVEPDALFEVARRNVLTRLEHELVPLDDDESPRIFRCASGDAFDGSRLVALPLLAKMRDELKAKVLLVAAPDRDTLLVATDTSPPTILRMVQVAESTWRESERGISPSIYLLTEELELGPLELVDDHPLRQNVRRGHLLHVDYEYASQKEMLDAQLKEQGAQLFVATHVAAERDGVTFSYCTWAPGPGPALLPQTDLVVFALADDRPPLVVPWDAVTAIAGELLEPIEGLEPARVRTRGFPDAAMFQALAETAIAI